MFPRLRPSPAPLALWSTAALLVGPLVAQDRRPVPTLEPEPEPPREVVAGGTVRLVPIDDLDDSVPLPLPPRYERGADGVEREVAPASGDPFFLGFAAGVHRPPADERVDPLLLQQVELAPLDRQGGDTYAFAMFSKRITAERLAVLEGLGARVLGRHPHYAVRIALPPQSIDALADLDFVRWVGVARPWQKIHPRLAQRLEQAAEGQTLDVWISVFESDLNEASTFEYVGSGSVVGPEGLVSVLPAEQLTKRWQSNGWQQAALQARGVEVRSYLDSVGAFRARLAVRDLARVRDLDFVQFLELESPQELAHDESMPMISADKTRVTDTGGTFNRAVGAVIDSGIEYSHEAMSFNGVGWDLAGTTSPWDDLNGHGTHVAGTYMGDAPSPRDEFTGVCPDLGDVGTTRVYNVKVFDDNGSWGGATLGDIFNITHNDYTYNNETTPHPNVLSNSWGSPNAGGAYIGTEVDPRLIDNESYIYKQLWVFAAGNTGPGSGTIWEEATSKNAFSVGNVVPYEFAGGDAGTIASGSSRGPCGDGRWKPNICAPGTGIMSANSADWDGYTSKSGTSMATPHVSGVASQLSDQWSFLQDHPYTLASVLMATAMTKDDQVLTYPTDSHLDVYGTGRVESYKALNPDSQQAMYFWGYQASDTQHAELDFAVSSGATRLTVVMTYYELAAGAGASKSLVDNLDMRLDREPFTGAGNTGDYYTQVSTIDNTEVRILNSPGTGNWKVKVYPQSVAGGWFRPWVGVCVIVTYGDTTPDGVFNLSADKAFAKPGQSIGFTSSVYNPSYVGSAVWLDSSQSSGFSLTQSEVTLADGAVASLMGNPAGGKDVLLGDIVHGQTRSVDWTGSWGSEGVKTFSVNLESDNMVNENKSVNVTVDGTPPSVVGNLLSTTHSVGGHYCGTQNVTTSWSAATDALAGVAGYALAWSNNAAGDPGTTIDTAGTSWSQAIGVSALPWYFHVRAIDKAGNAGPVAHLGPFHIGQAQVTSYCNSNLNSTGKMALLTTTGAVCLATNQLTLHTVDLPKNQFGYYLFSPNKDNVPFFGGSQGVLCLGGPIIRFDKFLLNSGAAGQMTFSPDLGNLPQGQVMTHGSTWNFQLWYRDKNPGTTSNTSNGIEIVWD